MNFLAHLYLSGDDNELLFGNFIGDLVKGSDRFRYPPPIRKGIELHRFIDDFTDHHPAWQHSRELLREQQHKYAGVVTDILYDHFLALNWNEYHPKPLEEFAPKVYELFQARYEELPERGKHLLPFMIKHNWLVAYKYHEGLERVLLGMSRRTKFESNMAFAVDDLKRNESELRADFTHFFPELIEASRGYLLKQ